MGVRFVLCKVKTDRAKGLLSEAKYRASKANDEEWKAKRLAYNRELMKARPDLRTAWIAKKTKIWRDKAPWMFSYRAARRRAKKYGLDFSLTLDWCREQWEVGFSPLSGLPYGNEKGSPYYPSIDRIDSALGYSQENCRMILIAENLFKNEWDDEAIIAIACGIADKARQ